VGTGFEPADPTGQRPQRCAVGLALATHARCLSAFVDIRRLDKSAFVCVSGRHSFAPVCEARVSNRHGTQSGPWPNYSTGSGGGSESDSCELCRADGVDLETGTVAGATLQLCSDCVTTATTPSRGVRAVGSGGQSGGGGPGSGSESDRRRRAARNAARMRDAQQADSSHWEDGADYDDDQLPYLVRDYGERVTEARQDAGLQTQELADGSTSTSRTCSPSNRRARRRPASAGRLSAHSRSASTSSSPKTPDTGDPHLLRRPA